MSLHAEIATGPKFVTPPEREANRNQHAAHNRADVLELVDAGFRYAFSLTHHRHDAEDLVQQACLRMIRKRGSVIERAYLFVVIRNLFHDGCRRRGLVAFAPLTAETDVEVDGEICRKDNRLDVESMLSTLSTEHRELMYLNCIEGFTAQEISDLTGHPRGTILSQLSRIRKKLMERFPREDCEARVVP